MVCAFTFAAGCLLLAAGVSASSSPQEAENFKVGERLTYTVGFEKFSNVAYAELYTASSGKIGASDAVELRAKVKTLDLVSAAFYLVDEARTIFASPASGLPMYIVRTQNAGGLPRESIQNYLTSPTTNYDLVTMIYRIRQSQGSGSFSLYEGDRAYPVNFQLGVNEKVKTDAGEFDTTVHSIQCEYFSEIGVRDLRMNLSTDEARIPVSFRFRTAKGEFHARLASIQNIDPQPEPTPAMVPAATPKPTVMASPTPTPRSYVDNQPLLPELSFQLGETLEYKLTAGGQAVGALTLQAAERKRFLGLDSLLLTATVTEAQDPSGVLTAGDRMIAQVNPDTLSPRSLEINIKGSLSRLSQSVMFDEKANLISVVGRGQMEAPVGTHNILSLLYAMRSFNLKPSRDTSNPINDTRVAVFWESRTLIFILRPSNAESIEVNGQRVFAQPVSINTGNANPQLDSLALKVWLSVDERRVPLRFSVGGYQADLVSDKLSPPK